MGDLRGERIGALQNLTGLSQSKLGEKLEISQPFVSKLISGDAPLPAEVAHKASLEFSLPLSFFTSTPGNLTTVVPTFRKNSTATVGESRKIRQLLLEANRAWSDVSEASGYVEFPDQLVAGDTDLSVEMAANNVREIAGLTENEPIANMTRLVERLGVAVIRNLAKGTGRETNHEGVSLPSKDNRRPLIATVHPLEGARARLTLAHELGHLIFDNDRLYPILSTRAVEEKRAFQFAAALLLPKKIAEETIDQHSVLTDFVPLKAKYGISVSAIIKRASDLGLITQTRARSLHIQISAAGWRTEEPVPVAEEHPILFNQAATRIWGDAGLSYLMSEQLGLSASWVSRWLEFDSTNNEKQNLAPVISMDTFRRGSANRAVGG